MHGCFCSVFFFLIHLIRDKSLHFGKKDRLTTLNYIPARRALPNFGGDIGIPCVKEIMSCDCFPSTSTVNLENGTTVTMSELQVGDKVQTDALGEPLGL